MSNKPKAMTPRAAHMAKRRASGLTFGQIAKEFQTSKSTAFRRVKAVAKPNVIRDGFNRLGSAT